MEKDDVRGSSIGYAINMVMDYGSGRQATISGTLPLGATLQEMNAELDKLRIATNRQQALVIIRDTEARRVAATKSVEAIEVMLVEYEKEMDKEISKISEGPEAKQTRIKSQIEAMRSQAAQWKQTKREELTRERGAVTTCDAVIAHYKKETED